LFIKAESALPERTKKPSERALELLASFADWADSQKEIFERKHAEDLGAEEESA
jgi:hypothetical protein